MAQFALGGVNPFIGQPRDYIIAMINETFSAKRGRMLEWEKEHPHRNPYPPSFPERALRIVREALHEAYLDEGSPAMLLEQLKIMCEKELDTEPTTVGYTDPEED